MITGFKELFEREDLTYEVITDFVKLGHKELEDFADTLKRLGLLKNSILFCLDLEPSLLKYKQSLEK